MLVSSYLPTEQVSFLCPLLRRFLLGNGIVLVVAGVVVVVVVEALGWVGSILVAVGEGGID